MSQKGTAPSRLRNEQGIALLAVMAMMVLLTGLGIAALTVTGMENTSAGFSRTNEASVQAAEACVQTGVQVIQQARLSPSISGVLLQINGGPVPAAATATLYNEIMLGTQTGDEPIGAAASPNLIMGVPTVNPIFQVVGDIDWVTRRLHTGGDATKDFDFFYRINCFATDVATSATTNVNAVYQCLQKGDTLTCQRSITAT